jgi:hypothetical protein
MPAGSPPMPTSANRCHTPDLYAAWNATIQLVGPKICRRGADPDADGFANFMEYALGGDPLASEIPESSPTVGMHNGILTLRFQRVADPALLYQVLAAADPAADPASWEVIWSSTGAANAAGPGDGFRPSTHPFARPPIFASSRQPCCWRLRSVPVMKPKFPILCALASWLCVLPLAGQWPPVPSANFSQIQPSQFADHELEVPYHLRHFAQVANAVVENPFHRRHRHLAATGLPQHQGEPRAGGQQTLQRPHLGNADGAGVFLHRQPAVESVLQPSIREGAARGDAPALDRNAGPRRQHLRRPLFGIQR